LVDALFDYLTTQAGLSVATVQQVLLADYMASGARASPHALKGVLPRQAAPQAPAGKALAQRQERHLDQALR
jgi:hypothetical protein